jgi:hypothetical protein
VKVTNYRHFQFKSKVTLVTLEEMLDINNNAGSAVCTEFCLLCSGSTASLKARIKMIRFLWSSGGDGSKCVPFIRNFWQLSG